MASDHNCSSRALGFGELITIKSNTRNNMTITIITQMHTDNKDGNKAGLTDYDTSNRNKMIIIYRL